MGEGDAPVHVFIKGNEVKRVDEHRYLGITFHNKLSFVPSTREKSSVECIALES